MANGFGNRFLWTAVRQSKDLPDGGNLFSVDFAPINRRLADAAETARTVKEMTRDAEAGAMWRAVYGELGAGRPGLLGAILSRAQPQVARLSCGYALLDGSAVVHAEHLLAALALWKYCEDSARFVFGDAMGDPDAEKLLAALRDAEGGLSRSEISITVFGKNKRKADICRLLGDLLSLGLIHRRTGPSTGGRPAERWFAGRKGADDAG
jgi:hypothetical protein